MSRATNAERRDEIVDFNVVALRGHALISHATTRHGR
jgi:hypothetical protein